VPNPVLVRSAHSTPSSVGQALGGRFPIGAVVAAIVLGALVGFGLPLGIAVVLAAAGIALAAHEGHLGERMRGELRPAAVVPLAGAMVVVELVRPMGAGATTVFTVVVLIVAAIAATALARAKNLR
jgi:hypothetical protein